MLAIARKFVSHVVLRLRRSTTCCGCGATHRRRNRDNSFSAFCADSCYAEFMEENYPNG